MQLRSYAALSLILASLVAMLALGGCGTSSIKVCNATGCCGPSDLCPLSQHLYANGVDGRVDVFPINGGSGVPGSPVSTPGATNSLGMAVLNNQFLYVSNPSLTVGGTSTIDAWSIDPGTGALTTVQGSPFSLGPVTVAVGLATSTTGQVLYVGDAGKIDALKADANGALSAVQGSPFPGATNLYLTVDPLNRFLFASDDTPPGNVLAFTIDASTGALGGVPGSPFPTIPGFVGNTQPREIVVDSSGSFVYTVLMSTGQVAGFSIVASTGALNPVPGSPFNAGLSPVSLATINNFLYVSNLIDGTISGYEIDATTGLLSSLSGSPFAIRGGPLTTDPAGRFLYTSGFGGLMTFNIDPTTGGLTPIGSTLPFAGATVLRFVQ